MKAGRAAELGDFQTPRALAAQIVDLVARRGAAPRAVLEPTAGEGSLLFAALSRFPGVEAALGVEINPAHVAASRREAEARGLAARVELREGDVFALDPARLVAALPRPLLVIGNPPWITSAALGALGSTNLPAKSNVHGRAGIAARTGQSNFDVSEWILMRLLDAIDGEDATLALLCKASVARKAARYAAAKGLRIRRAAAFGVDARAHFGAAVEACLFVCEGGAPEYGLELFADLDAPAPARRLAIVGAGALAERSRWDEVEHLAAATPVPWRSGIKHDCARVMELARGPDGGLVNRGGEPADVEEDHVFPLLKSSDLIHGRAAEARRWMLVPQRRTGDDPGRLAAEAPRAWRYLDARRALFAARRSSIYRGRPAFSIFGVGDYTFAPWKVAISGLAKALRFTVVGPIEGRPVVFDDTCYFLACADEAAARALHARLSTAPARAFLEARIFWSDKRPITQEILRALDPGKIAL